MQQVCRFFEEAVDDSIVDTSKLYEGCSIETLKILICLPIHSLSVVPS